MPTHQRPPDRLITALREFTRHAQLVWDSYQEHGPGKVAAGLFDGVDAAANELISVLDAEEAGDWCETVLATVNQLRDLAQRCACRSEGLCFVTGEAGLVPRRDLHEAYEAGLQELGRWCQILNVSTEPEER